MATGVASWSTTASNNATADSAALWPEGMAPSQVNDSARGGMAAVAKWRDDISGVLLTSGTSTAFTVSSNQGFASLANLDGMVIAFTPHTTSGDSPTLSVDGLTARPIRAAHNINLGSGVLLAGTPYVALYSNANSEFVLQGMGGNTYGIPLAAGMDYWANITPSSAFAFPNHQELSRSVYASLFNLIGTQFGSGDGTTTFNLPPKAGRVSVMIEPAATLLTPTYFGGDSTKIGATGGGEGVTMASVNLIQHDHTVFLHDPGHIHTYSQPLYSNSYSAAAGFGSNNVNTNANTSSSLTNITLWSDGDGTGTQNKVGKTGNATPTPMMNVQPTIACNYIMRII